MAAVCKPLIERIWPKSERLNTNLFLRETFVQMDGDFSRSGQPNGTATGSAPSSIKSAFARMFDPICPDLAARPNDETVTRIVKTPLPESVCDVDNLRI